MSGKIVLITEITAPNLLLRCTEINKLVTEIDFLI